MDKANYGLLINVLTWKFMAVDFNLLNLRFAAVWRLASATRTHRGHRLRHRLRLRLNRNLWPVAGQRKNGLP